MAVSSSVGTTQSLCERVFGLKLQEGPIPVDEAGWPFRYLQMALTPVYQANAPPLDKVIFAAPGSKRQQEGKGMNNPKVRKRRKIVAMSRELTKVGSNEPMKVQSQEPMKVQSQEPMKKNLMVPGKELMKKNPDSSGQTGSKGGANVEQSKSFNVSSLLDFDPSSVGEPLIADSPSISPLIAAVIATKIEDIIKQLETSIEQLVINCEEIRVLFESIADELPVNLKQILRPTAHMGFLREDVRAATSRIASRNNQPALQEEIIKECSTANKFKLALDDQTTETSLSSAWQELEAKMTQLTEEIKRLQQELADVEAAIAANNVEVKKTADSKRQLSMDLKASLSHIHSMNTGLISGSDKLDHQIISLADAIRNKAFATEPAYWLACLPQVHLWTLSLCVCVYIYLNLHRLHLWPMAIFGQHLQMRY
ncbi:hypothetical protein U9M48_001247, partial [Paspalum notatum var. saurae]